MAGILRIWLFIAVIIMPFMLQFSGTGRQGVMMASAEDEILPDVVDMDEDLDATIENDEGPAAEDLPSGVTEPVVTDTAETEKDEEEEDKPLKPSPDADTHILFIRPSGTDFPAGQLVKFLVGFSNKGDKDFIVETMDAAFRYPQDYSFYIQNFTMYRYYRTVEPNREATFEYAFTPGESFSARSFGLTINLNYRDLEGNMFQDAVFNTTVSVIEPDEGLDGETFFLYVFLIAIVVLLIVGAQQLLTSYSRKRMSSKPKQAAQQPVEMGTQNNKTDVDYSWLPEEMLQDMKRSPKTKTSPRQRTAKRRSGTGDD